MDRQNLMKCCICKYPRSGIGNKLLVLLRAYNVSKILSIPIYETNFSQLPLLSSFRNNVAQKSEISFFSQKNCLKKSPSKQPKNLFLSNVTKQTNETDKAIY